MWPIYQTLFFPLGSMAMELSDANLQTLTEYLKKTLDPDPAIRRPGKENFFCGLIYSLRTSDENLCIIYLYV